MRCRERKNEWQWRRRLAFIILAISVWNIRCSHEPDPQGEFDRVNEVFIRGDLTGAQHDSARDYQTYARHSPIWEWRFRVLNARILSWRGLNEQVLSVLSPAAPSSVLNSDLNLEKEGLEGLALGRLERNEEAQDKLVSALNQCHSINCRVLAELLAIKGLLDVDKGNYVSAKTSFEKVLELSRERKDAFLQARALLQLGYVTLQQDFFEESIEWSSQAAAAAREIGAQLVQSLAEGNLGWALYRTGDDERSLQLFLRAEKQAEESSSIDNQVKWLTSAGYVYVDQRQFGTAADLYRKALDLATKINSKEDILNAQISLAFLRVLTGEFDLADEYSDQVIRSARDNGNRVDELYGLLAKGEVAARRGNMESAKAIFSEVAGDAKIHSQKWDAEDELANLYAARHQPVKAEDEYKAALATFESARSLIHQEAVKLPFLENGSVLYDDYVGLLLSEGRSEEALAVADHNRARTLVEGLGQLRQKTTILPPRLDAQRIAGLARGVVLYYWLGEKESFLWAITANQTKVFHLPRAAEIDASVTRYRRALEGPEDVVHHFNSDGVELYRTLVQPAQRMFEKHTKIVVLPDGSLNALNFETLVVPGPEPHFWIEDVTLSRAPSLRLLGASLRRRSPAPGKLLIMGNPLSPSPEYSTPPQAALEIEDVKGHFPVRDQMILEKDRATPNAYAASHPEQFSYIHFVAHGIANHATPLDSAIILSRETGDNDSFRLYARDIIRHPLRAEIVSISACYGAGSRAYSGEGLVGLAWAFLQAGARNVVAALWDVSGASSPQLMNDMYAGITSGRPPDEALRQAKLSLLHSGTTFAKPFYWAPFLLYTGS